MGAAKQLLVAPISQAEAQATVERYHYSGRTVKNSQLHVGVFFNGKLEGALQFGPPLDRGNLLGLVRGTQRQQLVELNRMAFSDQLPRNSESRALGIVLRLLRKRAPQLKWVVSFADATQCGDGTIYRAAGFLLTQIARNKTLIQAPDGSLFTDVGLRTSAASVARAEAIMRKLGLSFPPQTAQRGLKRYFDAGFKALPGYQLRYVYFLDPSWRDRLACRVLPYSEIAAKGAAMYRGERAHAPKA